jgi:S1-C subfamily serine protease
LVRTFDDAGQPTIGSAFVVASDAEKSFLITSYATVKAATAKPGPDVFVRKGTEELKAALWTWQEEKDLALLIVNRGGVTRLDWSPASSVSLGDRVFAVSGLGTAGGSISQGFVADVSKSGLQHDAPLGTAFQGGPLLNSQGKVVAVASRSFAPLGFVSDDVYFAVPVAGACEKVLRCPNGVVTGAGAQR